MNVKLVKKNQCRVRVVDETARALNYVTKEFSPKVSVAVLEANEIDAPVITKYLRIYYVIEGELKVVIEGKKYLAKTEEALVVPKDAKYQLQGTFRAVVINQPAFGT